MMNTITSPQSLAAFITKAASKQTYYTIRFLVDRDRVADAYRAYAYFRWVDDTLDAETGSESERSAFIRRQQSLLKSCYRGKSPGGLSAEESMLIELVRGDTEKDSGLGCYLRNMMAVMAFDAERRGRLISRAQLNEYTRCLASAVTEAMHYFIGHNAYSPHDRTRYLAVTAAHITHMLRDTVDDINSGYYNIPYEFLRENHIAPQDVQTAAYRTWVRKQVELARAYFKTGKEYLHRVKSSYCRLAGFAYTARFEWLLNTIENEDFCLRPEYDERKSIGSGLQMSWLAFSSMMDRGGQRILPAPVRH